jgi:hypothetical protein
MREWLALVAVTVVALLALGCESDGGSGETPEVEATPQQSESQIAVRAREGLGEAARGLARESSCEALEFDGATGEWTAECVCPICFESQDIVVTMRVPDAPGAPARVERCVPLESGACKISPTVEPEEEGTGEGAPEG